MLVVSNGYADVASPDPSFPHNNCDCLAADGDDGHVTNQEALTPHGAKNSDNNCNYIFQNGGHHKTLDSDSNHFYKYKDTVSELNLYDEEPFTSR